MAEPTDREFDKLGYDIESLESSTGRTWTPPFCKGTIR